jgi:uncharacterized protein (TIGR03083 family)
MQRFLDSLRADGERFVEVVRAGPLDADVTSCPGWSLDDLAGHLAYIHRWVTQAVETGERPQDRDIARPTATTSDELGTWVQSGLETLLAALASRDVDAPTWHPFDAPMVLAVWPRRQAQETMIHRWDAEHAVGAVTPLDALIAADGILEFFELIVPRVVARDGRPAPKGVLRIECADVGFVCTVGSAGMVDVELGDGLVAAPDATIRGDAQDVLLALWRRVPLRGAHPALAQQWLEFGGN